MVRTISLPLGNLWLLISRSEYFMPYILSVPKYTKFCSFLSGKQICEHLTSYAFKKLHQVKKRFYGNHYNFFLDILLLSFKK